MAMPRFEKQVNQKDRHRMMLLLIIFLACYYILSFTSNDEEDLFLIPNSVPKEAFDVPFCDTDGTCHEKPDEASPRTVYSAYSKKQYEKWWSFHARLNLICEEYTKKRINNTEKQSLVLLGDSITESWRGTGLGEERHRADGVPEVLSDKFQNFDPVVLGISGDQTQHLLYRMQNGQLPSIDEESAIYVVMIGTNNLGSGELPGPTAKGIIAVADYLLSNVKGKLLLFQVLPRGDGSKVLQNLCPPRCSSPGKPFKSFMPAVNKVNEAVSDVVNELKEKYGDDRIGLIECNSKFMSLDSDDGEVNQSLMPDLLHPNAAGHVILADCILEHLSKSAKR